jgi:dihydrofolate reductase
VSRTQYYTATTLDGFIADPVDSLDWLFSRDQDRDGPLNYADFIAEVGALAMGRATYEWILRHGLGDDPGESRCPYHVPCWVFTHRQPPVVPEAQIELTSADVPAVHEEMVAAAGGKNVWIVGGGDLAGQFADAGLLDEVIVYIAPAMLGAGKPLLPRRIELRLEELARNRDFACARYAVVNPAGRGETMAGSSGPATAPCPPSRAPRTPSSGRRADASSDSCPSGSERALRP